MHCRKVASVPKNGLEYNRLNGENVLALLISNMIKPLLSKLEFTIQEPTFKICLHDLSSQPCMYVISKIGIKCKMRWFSLRNRASFYILLSSSERSKTYFYEEEFVLKRLQNLTQLFLKRTRKITPKCHAHKRVLGSFQPSKPNHIFF